MKLLLGQTLKESDVLYISLASIYGIGKNMAYQVCNRLGLSPMLRIYQIPNQKIAEIAKFLSILNTYSASTDSSGTNSSSIKRFPILPVATRVTSSMKTTAQAVSPSVSLAGAIPLQVELKKQIRSNINELISIKSYRGFRHVQHLPCRGQRTKTNAHTCKRIKPGA